MITDISTILMLASVAILVAFGAALYFASLDDQHEFQSSPPKSSQKSNKSPSKQVEAAAADFTPSRSPRASDRANVKQRQSKNKKLEREQQSEADKKLCEEILAGIQWRDQLDALCKSHSFQISDFDPKALRLLDEYFTESALDVAFDALKESVQNQPRNNIQNTRRYIYTLLRRVDREVYGKYKLKSREERMKDETLRTPQKKSRDSGVTVSNIREMIMSEPREQAPHPRTKLGSSVSPGKPHSWNAKAEEFEPGRRSHGVVEFVPGAISHGLMNRAASAV